MKIPGSEKDWLPPEVIQVWGGSWSRSEMDKHFYVVIREDCRVLWAAKYIYPKGEIYEGAHWYKQQADAEDAARAFCDKHECQYYTVVTEKNPTPRKVIHNDPTVEQYLTHLAKEFRKQNDELKARISAAVRLDKKPVGRVRGSRRGKKLPVLPEPDNKRAHRVGGRGAVRGRDGQKG